MKIKSKIFYTYVAFVIVYLLLTFLPAPDKAAMLQYHLTPTQLRLLDITLIIPILLIWFAAFYGSQRLFAYSRLIQGNKDGREVRKIAQGLFALAVGFALSSIVSSTLSIIARHHLSFLPTSVIISNYLGAMYPLVAFILLGVGARGLSDMAKVKLHPWALNVVVFVVLALGVVLCSLIAFDHTQLRTLYHLSPEVLMLTLGLPVTFIWFLGLQAAMELYVYGQGVAGVVYRKGWSLLSLGVGGIILINIALQYLGTLAGWLRGLSLTELLLLLYVLLLLLIAAFIVVALGAQKLTKIEEA